MAGTLEPYYWRERNREVDFVIRTGRALTASEVKKGVRMRVSDPIRIDALADVVSAVTMAVERWPEWTPTVTSVARVDSGPLKPGSAARLTQPMQPASGWVVSMGEARRPCCSGRCCASRSGEPSPMRTVG